DRRPARARSARSNREVGARRRVGAHRRARAEGAGFEPAVRVNGLRFSRLRDDAARSSAYGRKSSYLNAGGAVLGAIATGCEARRACDTYAELLLLRSGSPSAENHPSGSSYRPGGRRRPLALSLPELQGL